jgi:hypothetical protein
MKWWDPILRMLEARYKASTGLDKNALAGLLSIIQNNSITITQVRHYPFYQQFPYIVSKESSASSSRTTPSPSPRCAITVIAFHHLYDSKSEIEM